MSYSSKSEKSVLKEECLPRVSCLVRIALELLSHESLEANAQSSGISKVCDAKLRSVTYEAEQSFVRPLPRAAGPIYK